MIINGGARSGAKSLATHLLNQTKNEYVQVLEVRGCLDTDLRGALIEMEESALATRCQRALYHANIDPDRKVKMTGAQWHRAIDALEEKLGLQDHARAVVMHQKYGREHIHVVWNRIDLETMRTVHDSHNYRKHELVARELEREFGHQRVQGAHIERDDQPRPERTAPKWAMQQGERLKLDPRQVKAQVQKLWEASDSGRSFATALQNQGYILAKGDRRDFMVIDHAGGAHSLGRCTATKAAELRTRMAEIDRQVLPTVDQAVETMRERKTIEQTQKREAVGKEIISKAAAVTFKPTPTLDRKPEPEIVSPAPLPRPPEQQLDETTADIRAAYVLSGNANRFADALEKSGIHLAAVTTKEAQRNPAYNAGEIVAIDPTGQVYFLDRHTTGEERAKVETFLGALDRKKLQGIEATQQEMALRAEQFRALSQVGLLKRPEPERSTSLPSQDAPVNEKVDFERYLNDPNYRREIQRQQEKEKQQPDRERGPGLDR